LVEADNTLVLTVDEKVNYSRPSIDVLFESAADAFGGSAIGIILSGANNDGARGLQAIADAGGRALVEDPALATVSEMPRAALDLVPLATVLPANDIGLFLVKQASQEQATTLPPSTT
jgi:two-component system chemotaxis response regulator CheB